MRKSKRKLTYKKELKKLYREYKKITNNAYTMRGYNRWKQKVIKLLRMVEDRESFAKYLEINRYGISYHGWSSNQCNF